MLIFLVQSSASLVLLVCLGLDEGTTFGDMNTIHSIRVDGRAGGSRLLDDPRRIKSWLNENTDKYSDAQAHDLPCAAAEQLRHLFRKYIRPDGSAKRNWVGADAVSRGTKHINRPEDCNGICSQIWLFVI